MKSNILKISSYLEKNYLFMVINRVAFGILWLEAAHWKAPPNFGLHTGGALYYWVNQAVKYPVLSIYTSFVENIVLPNFLFFGWSVFLIEIALGIAFILGLKTRLASVVAFVQTIFIALSAINAPGEWPWSYYLMLMVSIALFTHDTSLSKFSFDYWITKRIKKS